MKKNRLVKILTWFVPSKKARVSIRKFFTEECALERLGLTDYQISNLLNFNEKYPLEGKVVLEIGSDLELKTVQGMLHLGAKEVYAVNPQLLPDKKLNDKRLHLIKSFGENTGMPDKHFDVIFGIALLEHVSNPEALASECERMLKDDGICFLQGCPMWTEPHGHHIYIKNTDGSQFLFHDETNPFEAWAHLVLSKDEISNKLKSKNISDEHIGQLIHFITESDCISRLSPSYLIEKFQANRGIDVKVARYYSDKEKNEHFQNALNQFSKDDLETSCLELYITKK